MALYDSHAARPVVSDQGFGARITKFLSGAYMRFADCNDARVTRKALRKLTDRELDDLGLSRAGARRIALEAAYGPNV